MVRVLMIQRAISVKSLAESCGVTARTMANQIAANFPSRRLRGVVETILGVAIWSAPDDFARRQSVARRLGVNLAAASRTALQRHAAGLKISGRANRRRTNLISLLETHFENKTPN